MDNIPNNIDKEKSIGLDTFQFSNDSEGISILNDHHYLHIQILSSTLFRARYKSAKYWERDFSYAIDPGKTFHHDPTMCNAVDLENILKIETNTLIIIVDKRNLLISVEDKSNIQLSNDIELLYNTDYEKGTTHITYTKSIMDGEHIYGLGDKSCPADLRGRHVAIWGTDRYGFESWDDPLYKNIPFHISLHHNISYGIFLDNTHRMQYDVGLSDRHKFSIKIDGGELNYYFIYGPAMLDVTRQYTLLTGVPELPPLWALGYQQSKWSYYPADNVYDIAHQLRLHRIPCDVIYLDIDYMDGFRCFTWDKDRFPDPKKLVQDLKEMGFKTIVIIDPGIKIDTEYVVYQQGCKDHYFVRGDEGGYVEGKVWPGDCHFPDFVNPLVREWWGDLFQELVLEIGIDGVWNDMNEPALFEVPNKSFPNNARHNYEGDECSHRRVHNVYGMQMTRATYDGVKKYRKDKRPLILTRSTYAGGQRYSAGWTGDNKASWEHISIANIQAQRLSICGYSYVGADIGGFIDQPSAELFVRWIAAAVLHPFFRNHSSGDHGNQEPWAFDNDTLDLVRAFIELRYQFLPYIYTTFYKYVSKGLPMIMPSYMYDQDDMHTHYRSDEVLIGDQVLIAPVYEEDSIQKSIYLPKGNWYNYFDERFYKGNSEYIVPTPLDQACLFIKGGTILPRYPVMNYVGESRIDQLLVKIYFDYGDFSSLLLYEDDGEGYEYTQGIYNEVNCTIKMNSSSIALSQTRSGQFSPSYTIYHVTLIGLPSAIQKIVVDDISIAYDNNEFICDFDFGIINIILA